jgi:hypothetical protein
MAKLQDVLAYLLENYPHESERTEGRITRTIFLADWKHVLEQGEQITDIHWFSQPGGPYVRDIVETARAHPELFRVEPEYTISSGQQKSITCVNCAYRPRLDHPERRAIDHVIQVTKSLDRVEFARLVTSTYPVLASERYTFLDLKQAAAQYQRSQVDAGAEVAAISAPALPAAAPANAVY